MDLVTGYKWASTASSANINGETSTLVGLGARHAAYAGTTVALCGQSLAHIEPGMPFGTGGLGAPLCALCVAKTDPT